MQEFLATIVSFPTIVFSFAMGVVVLYWLVVIFGALDLDFLDSVLGLDSMDSALDGALDSLDGAMDGAVDGAVDGAADGAADVAEPTEGTQPGILAGLLNALGVRGVPITVVGSLVTFWAWVVSYWATRLLGSLAASLLVAIAIAATSALLALVLGALSSQPMKKLFQTHLAPKRASLVGKFCTVTSARVDEKFGRAEIEDGAAGFVAEVRCPQENELNRGSKALVYRYEPKEGIFFIGPIDAALDEATEVAEASGT